MRRVKDDRGAVAVLVAILAVVLFGFAALVIDVGVLVHERRQLQNGADAAALAVAQSCAAGSCSGYAAQAETYADTNARDGAARIPVKGLTEPDQGVCGSVGSGTAAAGMPACDSPPSGLPGAGYVRVTAKTEEPGGAKFVPPILARILNPDYDGTDVKASTTVVWGAPGGATSAIPVTMSKCELDKFLAAGLAPAPDYATYPGLGYSSAWLTSATGGKTYERTFYTHDGGTAAVGTQVTCPATAPGGDASGSFGWLSDTDGLCSASTTLSADGDVGYENQPGNTVPSVCKSSFPPVGTIVHLPVYDYFTVKGAAATKGGGQDVWYHVEDYAAFYITGYNLQLPAGGDRKSIVTGALPCSGSARCISGFFTNAVGPANGPVASGTSLYGSNITQIVQ